MYLPRFRATPAGDVRVALAPEEREALRELAGAVRELVGEDTDDPSLRRLFPPAHDDPELQAGYSELTRAQLKRGREQALDLLQETVDQDLLSADEADAWLRALNDVRLVLGTRLDVTEDFDWEGLRPDDPRAADVAAYAYSSWLQEQLVEATGRLY
ncbi:MAG TPA: DUF2017 family protein [Gaiellaceae bacterium]|jgi:hypothetical protein|nr:DUF2017 family protein [Gaiellaceae bacterium]